MDNLSQTEVCVGWRWKLRMELAKIVHNITMIGIFFLWRLEKRFIIVGEFYWKPKKSQFVDILLQLDLEIVYVIFFSSTPILEEGRMHSKL